MCRGSTRWGSMGIMIRCSRMLICRILRRKRGLIWVCRRKTRWSRQWAVPCTRSICQVIWHSQISSHSIMAKTRRQTWWLILERLSMAATIIMDRIKAWLTNKWWPTRARVMRCVQIKTTKVNLSTTLKRCTVSKMQGYPYQLLLAQWLRHLRSHSLSHGKIGAYLTNGAATWEDSEITTAQIHRWKSKTCHSW